MGSLIVQGLCPEVYDPEAAECRLAITIIFIASMADILLRFTVILAILYILAACEEMLSRARVHGLTDSDDGDAAAVDNTAMRLRDRRAALDAPPPANKKICGATTIRLNLDLNKVWLPNISLPYLSPNAMCPNGKETSNSVEGFSDLRKLVSGGGF